MWISPQLPAHWMRQLQCKGSMPGIAFGQKSKHLGKFLREGVPTCIYDDIYQVFWYRKKNPFTSWREHVWMSTCWYDRGI